MVSKGANRRHRQKAGLVVEQQLAVLVVIGGSVVGYIEMVGSVFVSLKGPRYDIAVEVAQSMAIEAAHTALL